MGRALAAVCAVLALTAPAARAADQEAIDRAVERGVTFLRSAPAPGAGEANQPEGVAALTGLALLECGVPAEDKTVRAAVESVRQAGPSMDQTYTLALGLLLLDRLGDPADEPQIESMGLRLLAGQNAAGGWTYSCPAIAEADMRRLTTLLGREAGGRPEPADEGPKDGGEKRSRRTFKDLPKELQQRLLVLTTQGPPGMGGTGDNSNTQFATVALWVARRHGLPADAALLAVGRRYRATQNPDGGWAYTPAMGGSTATMTCAGLLGLAAAHGAAAAEAEHDKGKIAPDVNKDRPLKAALALLGTAVGGPVPRGGAPAVGGKTYYFFWSLERVAVGLDLDKIGGKDWYAWGSDVLVANQGADGSWRGEYPPTVDTSFAILFLKRANLTADLTAGLKGKLKDGAVTLRTGGVGGEALTGRVLSGVESRNASSDHSGGAQNPPAPPAAEESEGARMARELAQAPAGRRDRLLDEYRDGKGVTYTEALAGAIPQLAGEARRQTRDALADRLTRMKPETLARYLHDQDAEIRRAAALAAAQRSAKGLIPDLIPLLDDAEPTVARAAHAALKDLSGESLGPSAADWKAWWAKQPRP